MPEEILKSLLITSLAGSALALVITLLKPITKKLFGYKWHYYIWLAVLIVMILPVRFTIPNTEKLNLQPINTPQVQTIPTEELAIKPLNQTEHAAPSVVEQSPVKNGAKILTQIIENRINIIGAIWLLGMLIMLSMNAIGYLRLLHKIHKKSVVISCPEIHKYTKRKVTVRTCGNLSSPFMFGIFRPNLILPNVELTPEQLDNILQHEMTHLKRNDIFYKWFATLIKTVHWFNPLIYYVMKQINTECEISCDLSVVKNMDKSQEINYVNTIISLLAVNKAKSIPLTTGMTGNKKMLKRRFTMIRNKKTTSKLMSLLSALVAVVMLTTTVFASGVLSDMTTDDYKIEITFANNVIDLTNKPFIENGIVYVPLRETLEKIGIMDNPNSKIIWDNGRIELVIAETRTDTYIAEQHQQFGVDEVDFIHSYGIEIGKPTIIHNLEYPKLINFEKNELPSVTNTRGLVNPVLKNNKTYITYYTLTQLLNNTENYRNTKYVVYDKNGKFIFGSDLDKTEMVSFSFDKFSHKVIEPTPQPIPEYHSDDETMACYDVINDMELSFEKNGYIVRENYFTDKCEDQTWKTWNGIGTVCSIYLYTDGDYRVTFIAMPNIGDKQQVITARMKKQANGKYLIDSFYTTHLPADKGVFVSEETGQPYSADTVNEGLE